MNVSHTLAGRHDDFGVLLASLPRLPAPTARPVLVVMSGLPGTGKSTVARALAARFPLLHLESDSLRRILFPLPAHSAEENARLFPAAHRVIGAMMDRRIPVLFDATNLLEAQRALIYRMVEERGGGLVVVRVVAPEGVVRERLARRATNARDPKDRSEADWSTYLKMREGVEPIRCAHQVVDTSRDIGPAVGKIAARIEWEAENGAEGTDVSRRRGEGGPRRGRA